MHLLVVWCFYTGTCTSIFTIVRTWFGEKSRGCCCYAQVSSLVNIPDLRISFYTLLRNEFGKFVLTYGNHFIGCYAYQKKPKSFPSHKGPLGGADFCFNSPQPDTSRSCKSMDTGLVCRVGCLFSSQLAPVPIYCLVNRGTCVNNLPKVGTWSAAAGNQTCDLSVAGPTP